MFSNADAAAILQIFQPITLFDPTERFFPVAAEEWLDQRAAEGWTAPTTHRRGTAVIIANRSATSFGTANVAAGSDFPAGAHIALSDQPPEGIGQTFAVAPNQDLFLDVGGWDNVNGTDPSAPHFTSGSAEYLDLLFRTVSHALNPALPPESPTIPPNFDLPRLNVPTIYAECEWAGMYPRLDHQRAVATGSPQDFPPAIGTGAPGADNTLHDLDNYIALTYYMLYPAMEPSPSVNDQGVMRREGQWEAITVFLRGKAETGQRDKDGRPDFPVEIQGKPPKLQQQGLTPRFVAYSQGYDTGSDSDTPLAAEVRTLFPSGNPDLDVHVFSNHALAYVTAGTHKNLFDIAAIVHTGDSPPNPVLNPLGGAIMGAAGTAAGVCLGLAPPPLTPACIVCLAIAAIAFLIGLILFLLSFLIKDDPPVDEAPDPGGTDLARDGGPGALPAGQPAPTVPGLQPVGAAVSAVLRLINRFKFDPVSPVTTYPLPAPLTVELPTWWDFPGRWGVRILNRATNEWDSGTRRTDTFARSRAYWNTYRLVAFLNDPARAADGIAP